MYVSHALPGMGPLAAPPYRLHGEVWRQDRNVGVVAGGEAALAAPLADELRRRGRGHARGLGDGAAGEGQDVHKGLPHGQHASGDGPAPEPRDPAVGVHGAGGQTILTVLHARRGYGVGDEAEAVRTEHTEGEPDHLGMDM